MRNQFGKRIAGYLFILGCVFTSTAAAQSSNVVIHPTYVTIRLETVVNRPAVEVWKRVGKFCDIGEWMQRPCTILSGKDGEVGAVRSVGAEIFVATTEFS